MHQPFIYVITYSFLIEGEKVMAIWNDAFFTSKIQAEKKTEELSKHKEEWVHYQVETLVKETHNYD